MTINQCDLTNYANNTLSTIVEKLRDIIKTVTDESDKCIDWLSDSQIKSNPDKLQLSLQDSIKVVTT